VSRKRAVKGASVSYLLGTQRFEFTHTRLDRKSGGMARLQYVACDLDENPAVIGVLALLGAKGWIGSGGRGSRLGNPLES
jgi:hypothetical protein